jgi:ATP-dependent DNA ligase
MTQDVAAARAWLAEHTHLGVEGVVAKRLTQGYRPERRTWGKVTARATVEAVVGGVVGPLDAPAALVGCYDQHGRLRVIGRTHPLPVAARAGLARLVRPATGVHPWPTPLPGSRFGLPRHHRPGAPVQPTVVVELEVDSAFEYGRFRHGVRYLRTRAELCPGDLPALTPGGTVPGTLVP